MTNNIVQIDLGIIENNCFVVMPFSPLFQTQYTKVIQEALRELNIECIRGDEIYSKQRIMDDIWHSIKRCRFVLAELTERNPNVLYEIGLAHAIGKPIIIITRNADDVPFDLKDLRYLYYDTNDPFWGDNLKKGIKVIVQKVLDNPEIDTYLNGISYPNKIQYSEILKLEAKKVSKKIKDVSGIWNGIHYDAGNRENIITLNISQKEDELFATSINSVEIKGSQTVIQQIMNGFIKDKTIKLTAVNYTYIQRGNSTTYDLDNYTLLLDEEKGILKGKISSINGYEGEFKLEKYNSG